MTAPIGELSAFHETFGSYAQGVSVATTVLPAGWRDRLVTHETPDTEPGRGLCLEPHDCVASKLVAGRSRDLTFARALLRERLIDSQLFAERIDLLPVTAVSVDRAAVARTSKASSGLGSRQSDRSA